MSTDSRGQPSHKALNKNNSFGLESKSRQHLVAESRPALQRRDSRQSDSKTAKFGAISRGGDPLALADIAAGSDDDNLIIDDLEEDVASQLQ